ncbi:hypothetical protein BsWGS_18576 [Bradybaena similaris]
MKLLALLTLSCTVLTASAQSCPPTEVVFLLDESENAARAASTDRVNSPFNLLKQAIRNFLLNTAIYNAGNVRVGAYGYSGSSPPATIIPQGTTPPDALNYVENIGRSTPSGSWTYRGLEMVNGRPMYANNLMIVVSSQGSGTSSRRNDARNQVSRIIDNGWTPYVIALQGLNTLDIEELTVVNNGRPPVILVDRFPQNSADPKSYNELNGEFINIINNVICTATTTTSTTTTTTTRPLPTRSTTERESGLCSECLFQGGYGFDFDPQYCDTFFQCFPGAAPIKKSCADGTFWDGVQCNHIAKVSCPTAVCDSRTSGSTYPSGKCCNKYYLCANNGEMVSTACPLGQIYDEYMRACRPVGNLTVSCAETGKLLCDVDLNGPIGPGACAGYAPDIFGNPCKFQFYQRVFDTAPGTYWNQASCSLVRAQDSNMCLGDNITDRDFTGPGGPAAVCNAVFLATYNGGSNAVYSERLNRQLNVYSFLQEAYLVNDGVTFTSQMRDPMLYYYFFNNRELASNIAFSIRFRLDLGFGNAQQNTEYDILSNSYCAQCRETVSFTVVATSSTRHVVTATFLTNFGNTVSTSAIIEKNNPTDWLELRVIFGDTSVSGKLYVVSNFNGVSQSSDFNTVPKTQGSTIETNRCGFQLGRGSHSHLIGIIDQFAFYEYCQDITTVLR